MTYQTQHWLFHALRSLSMPTRDYVVVGSAPLSVYGIRCCVSDLDVLARGEAWRIARDRAEKIVPGVFEGLPIARVWGGTIEVFTDWLPGLYRGRSLLDRAVRIDGIPFATLPDVLRYKRYTNRPKDRVDVRKIEEHLRHRLQIGPHNRQTRAEQAAGCDGSHRCRSHGFRSHPPVVGPYLPITEPDATFTAPVPVPAGC